jgi:23S rRNA pseudouridine2605 synthase
VLSLKRGTRDEVQVEERLQKVLANAGQGSRRSVEERIAGGEIRVNGHAAELGTTLKSGDRVEMDGKAWIAVTSEPEDAHVLIYHKPEGEVTTHDDPEGRPTVFERMPRIKSGRWVSVGRLDINTTGLLLMTTDGELANALMHPSREVEREYVCRIHGTVADDVLERLKQGVELEDGPARFDEIGIINRGESHSWFRVVLREGRNREVRRLWESQGLQVSRLKRIRYGSVELPRQLRRGHVQDLTREEYQALRSSVGLEPLPKTLTLQPLIGVRRAAKQQNEFRPTGRGTGWSSATSDEARELRAFDFVREDNAPGRRQQRRGKKPRRGGKGAPPGAGAGQQRRGGPGRGTGSGPMRGPGGVPGRGAGAGPGRGPGGGPGRGGPGGRGNSAERRSWSPGGQRGNDRQGFAAQHQHGNADSNQRGPQQQRGSKNRRGPKPGHALPFGFPSDHAYAQRFVDQAPGSPRPPGRRGRGRGRGRNPES